MSTPEARLSSTTWAAPDTPPCCPGPAREHRGQREKPLAASALSQCAADGPLILSRHKPALVIPSVLETPQI